MSKEIIKAIQDTALKCSIDNVYFTRRSLQVYFKEEYNITVCDDLSLNHLVQDAYYASKHSQALQDKIENAFLDNSERKSLYSPSLINIQPKHLVENNTEEIAELIKQQVEIVNELYILSKDLGLDEEFNKLANNLQKNVKSGDFLDSITGGKKVKTAFATAENVYNTYQTLIFKYDDKKDQLNRIIKDYETIRDQLKMYREDIVEHIIDIFGDKIKDTDPHLFDYSSLSFLETSNYIKKIDLFFDDISNSCKTFMAQHYQKLTSEIGTSIKSNAKASLNKLGNKRNLKKGDVKGELIGAGVNIAVDAVTSIVQGRQEAKEKAIAIERDTDKMRNSFAKDRLEIEQDIIRLQEISFHVGDVFLPQTLKFQKEMVSILNHGLLKNIEVLKQDVDYKNISEKRTRTVQEIRSAELHIKDIKENIDAAMPILRQSKENKDKFYPFYQQCVDNEPSKPSLLINILSLGIASFTHKTLYEQWWSYSEQHYETYNQLTLDVQKEEDYISAQNDIITQKKQFILEKKIEAEKYSYELRQIIQKNEQREILAKNLTTTIQLVKASKILLEAELDDHLIDASRIQNEFDSIENIEIEESHINEIATPSSTLSLQVGHLKADMTEEQAEAFDALQIKIKDRANDKIQAVISKQKGVAKLKLAEKIKENWSSIENVMLKQYSIMLQSQQLTQQQEKTDELIVRYDNELNVFIQESQKRIEVMQEGINAIENSELSEMDKQIKLAELISGQELNLDLNSLESQINEMLEKTTSDSTLIL
ncbi:hypothetical protein [Flammeovirga agarivorans]|uniref:Uncharacterized protein n=1 Tax=Flammeovirga agarivorans TaxID=2726742 RepID=A0A7X8SGG7_9BACT|nr:hypothetical protein [Flammeovirga agarivorans]NLR89814.1 hypothetical protein [Flammeovirga agarivorans]